jgi:hypothetical protein
MAFDLDVALQTIAALVIFLVGYSALFISLFICFAIVKGLYDGAWWIWTYGTRLASARRQKALVISA